MSALGSTAVVAPASAPLTSHGVPASFDTEQVKDIWNMAVFGHDGRLTFTGITQPWLRESTKRWAAEDLPVRRGKTVTGALRAYVNALAKLSESLRAHRSDHGLQPQALGRRDVETFLHRLGYLEQNGEISAHQRHHTCRMVRHTLRQMRALGLTRAGGPLAGLPEDFALRERDLPPEPEREEPWRALPTEILRQLCNALPVLEERGSRFVRVAVELLIDTGRRPVEVCQLPFNCLDRDGEGKYMLIYDDFKNDKPGRRLPIADATAALIIEQQKSVQRRYPATKPAELKLLPPVCRNPYGRRAMTYRHLANIHRDWIDTLPPLLQSDNSEYDKTQIVLYVHRHTYAQRHADAGVPVDVLRDLMGHDAISSTQVYYRISENRRRAAIDRVAVHQFDRHGNRVWRQAQALLDHEHVRRSLGEVSVPYGVCHEPSNVAAGGGACPFRFRCVGCDHFRTDVSYLPDLKAYLHDLLRDRERVLAAVDVDDWARTEALPSENEIGHVKALIRRVEEHVDQLTLDERAEITQATAMLRRARQVVGLGMPHIRTPEPNLRLERP